MSRLVLAGVVGIASLSVAVMRAQQQPAQSAAPVSSPTAESARTVENGKKLFEKYGCSDCHGLLGQGAPTSGPRIAPNPLPVAAFIRYVRAPRLQMPPYTTKVVPDQELSDIRAYLVTVPKPAPASLLKP
jgi:mono/diheme cytochrome c family protein